MGKFRVRVKITGFELEVDGDREDLPAITNLVHQQLAGVIQPPDFTDSDPPQRRNEPITIESSDLKNKRAPRKRGPRTNEAAASAVDFRHESGKFGSPKQSWSIIQKCVWLLYVLEGIAKLKEVTSSQLTSTFNSQFKAAGKLHPPNVSTALSAAKVAVPALVGEDKLSWFLTDEGKTYAQGLVKEGLGKGE